MVQARNELKKLEAAPPKPESASRQTGAGRQQKCAG